MKRIFLLAFMALAFSANSEQKKLLTWSDVVKWNRITEKSINDKGDFIAVKSEPWKGVGLLKVYDNKARFVVEFKDAKSHEFISDELLMFVKKPSQQFLDSLERAKSKDKAQNQLVVYNLKTSSKIEIDSLKSYKTYNEDAIIAYKRGDKKCNTLIVTDFDKTKSIKNVKEYFFAEDAKKLVYSIADSLSSSVGIIDLESFEQRDIFSSKDAVKRDAVKRDTVKRVSISKNGDAVAFIVSDREDKSGVSNKLYTFIDVVKEIEIPSNSDTEWIINEFAEISFSEDNSRLYYGTSPRYIEKDTTILKSEKAVVDVWSWNEPVLHTQQLVNKERELKRSYKAVAFLNENRSVQLANRDVPTVTISEEGNGDVLFAQAYKPYMIEMMWKGSFATPSDLYIIDINNGNRTLVKKEIFAKVEVSPKGKYLYWYLPADSSWYSYSVEQKKEFKLASSLDFITYNDKNDVPSYPREQGEAGWLESDEMFYVYGKYDIWALDVEGRVAPKNITQNGTKESKKYSIVTLDDEKESFEKREKLLLHVVDDKTKHESFATVSIEGGEPNVLITAPMHFSNIEFAKNSDKVIYTKESFDSFPNIYLSDISFKKTVKISDVNDQQSQFNWGTVEQVSWVSLDGDTLNGLLYKPENFDKNKKYPMICNFYERDSHNLLKYKTPEPHRSTIDYHYYTSNGYVIFNPDIKYKEGYPGESCYNSVMPGIEKVLSMGFVDPKRIGAQGHSWGGYQVAYLATKTDLFAAIESGAPVVNMLSAYGGIRWETGLNRSYQYERGQSRIGKHLWDAPDKYLANSPLMNMDKVTTPILIMHNDADGHVPWWQGIEYFIALRRLQKPVWMLNYNGEPHWPMKLPNRIDFQVRMAEFFDYYLQDKAMPKWMRDGVPAIENN